MSKPVPNYARTRYTVYAGIVLIALLAFLFLR